MTESVAPGTLPCLCNTSAGPAGCPLHSPARAVVAAALAHEHHWVYDGHCDAGLIYHCDAHDPPFVRMVAALAEEPKP